MAPVPFLCISHFFRLEIIDDIIDGLRPLAHHAVVIVLLLLLLLQLLVSQECEEQTLHLLPAKLGQNQNRFREQAKRPVT